MKRWLICLALAILPLAAQTLPNATPLPSAVWQFVDANGVPLAGGKLYTCFAGLSCPGNPQATYTNSTAAVQNANPVILDSAGRVQVWLGPQAYRLVLQDANSIQQWTQDNVSDTAAYFVNYVRTAGTATLITYTPTQTGGTSRTVASKLNETLSAKDFGCAGDGVTDDTACLQNLINAAATAHLHAFVPGGTYLNTGILMPNGVEMVCDSELSATLLFNGATTPSTYTYAIKLAVAAPNLYYIVRGCNLTSKNGTGTSLTAGLTSAFGVDGCQYCIIENNNITNFQFGINGGSGTGNGVYFSQFRGNHIYGSYIGISMVNSGANMFNSDTVADNRLDGNVYAIYCDATCRGNLIYRNDVDFMAPLSGNTSWAYYINGDHNTVMANWMESEATAGKTLVGLDGHLGYANNFINNIVGFINSGGTINCYFTRNSVPASDYWSQGADLTGVCPALNQMPFYQDFATRGVTDMALRSGSNQFTYPPFHIQNHISGDYITGTFADFFLIRNQQLGLSNTDGGMVQTLANYNLATFGAQSLAHYQSSTVDKTKHLLTGITTDKGAVIQAFNSATPSYNHPLLLQPGGGVVLVGNKPDTNAPTGGSATLQAANNFQIIPGGSTTCDANNQFTLIGAAGTPDILYLCFKDGTSTYALHQINVIGLTQTLNMRKSDNSGACTATLVNGVITATTCP